MSYAEIPREKAKGRVWGQIQDPVHGDEQNRSDARQPGDQKGRSHGAAPRSAPTASGKISSEAQIKRHVDFQPLGNRVLVRRLRQRQKGLIDTSAHDEKAGSSMILTQGEILAAGPDCEVQPGQHVIFNARWNDFANPELLGSDSDKKGPLERPMPQWQYASGQKDLHLITEGDIAGILNG